MYHPDHWQPTASIETLKIRAALLQNIRTYFANEGVLEVDTPCLSLGSISDPHIEVLTSTTRTAGKDVTYYLQTSPEFAMKRLLCAEAPSIYQLGKVFRAEEIGRRHSIEFTMLEWYRVAFDHWQLMDDMERLLNFVVERLSVCSALQRPFKCKRLSYRKAFLEHLQLDPFSASLEQLQTKCHQLTEYGLDERDRDTLLELMFSAGVEPNIGLSTPCFIFDYPESQAALAKKYLDESGNAVSARFELYWQGMELANGYYELTDAKEQEQRIDQDMSERLANGQVERIADKRLVTALRNGMPDCAGVALGVDRLLMLLTNQSNIDKVIPFAADRV